MNVSEWLGRLISFDTTSRHSNLALIDCVEAWCSRHGIAAQIINDPIENKANLFATIPAANGSLTGGIIFSGHTDVVPVDGQDWQTNPFEAVEIANKIYGRGAADMKGFIAVVLKLIPEFIQMKLAKPIHIALSYDEEVGCGGAKVMLKELQRLGMHADACLIGEPTLMKPIISHKGIQVFHCRVRGRAAHSSLTPEGCNAIDYACQVISYLREFAHILKHDEQDDQFDVPYTTLSTNIIKGGNAFNTIPESCEFYFEFRNLPQLNPRTIREQISTHIQQKILPMMKKEFAEASIEIEEIANVPSFAASSDAQFTKQISDLTNCSELNKVAYATEAGLFQAYMPTLVCGPGSIEQAHRANEYVEIEQLRLCEEFLKRLISSSSS